MLSSMKARETTSVGPAKHALLLLSSERAGHQFIVSAWVAEGIIVLVCWLTSLAVTRQWLHVAGCWQPDSSAVVGVQNTG